MNMRKSIAILLAVLAAAPLLAQNIKLPAPGKTGGKPFMQCLAERKTVRSFKADAQLTEQQISNLLYAAWGFNRPGKRTVPTARNMQDSDLYIALKSGVYHYNAKDNVLELKVKGDHKAVIGRQTSMFRSAAAVLIYVSDFNKMKNMPREKQILYSAAHAGSAYQDVYLYCASENLGTVVCGLIFEDKIRSLLKLPKTTAVLFAQPVGVLK